MQVLLAWRFHCFGMNIIPSDAIWGFGPHGPLLKNLVAELSKHGIPPSVVEERANAAIKTLGSEQILAALSNRNPWKQLKMLGNNSKFQFVMPSELAAVVDSNREKRSPAKVRVRVPKLCLSRLSSTPANCKYLRALFMHMVPQ